MRTGGLLGCVVASALTASLLAGCNGITPTWLGDTGVGVADDGSPVLVIAACDEVVTSIEFTSGNPPISNEWVAGDGRTETFDVDLEEPTGWKVVQPRRDVLPATGEVLAVADFEGRTENSGLGLVFYTASSFDTFEPGYVYVSTSIGADGPPTFDRFSRDDFTQGACDGRR